MVEILVNEYYYFPLCFQRVKKFVKNLLSAAAQILFKYSLNLNVIAERFYVVVHGRAKILKMMMNCGPSFWNSLDNVINDAITRNNPLKNEQRKQLPKKVIRMVLLCKLGAI